MHARRTIAVIGSGISGLSAAWLLSQRHDVTVLEAEPRAGGHSNTVDAPGRDGLTAVDTGFIVYNTASYPNLIALFDHLGVPTAPSSMSFAVSLDEGRYEYSGSGIASLFGQPANLASPSHWRMIADTLRFFRESPRLLEAASDEHLTLGQYLASAGYSEAFISRHILPMAAAIWSTPSHDVLAFPAAAFVRFFANHGLLQVRDRPAWRTVVGGSREYVRRLVAAMPGCVALGEPVLRIARCPRGVTITTAQGARVFDACVVATHADDALALLGDADADERTLLGAFHYQSNVAVLHRDPSLMPRRRRLWSSWNYLGSDARGDGGASSGRRHVVMSKPCFGMDDMMRKQNGAGTHASLSLTYWMNNLQPLGTASGDLFVTLNPGRDIATGAEIARFDYAHPMFDAAAMAAQRQLWRLQGRRGTWFCGSYFGYGFHEDGLQSGLAVAEDIGGVRRPWHVADPSGRIHPRPAGAAVPLLEREAAE